MICIANPPFNILNQPKRFRDILLKFDEYVVLATFLFCNNAMNKFELVEYREWPEVTSRPLAIAATSMKCNHIEKPLFYKPMKIDHNFEGSENFLFFHNTHFIDGIYEKIVKQNLPNKAKLPIWEEINDDIFICKGGNKNKRVGERLTRKIYPRYFKDIVEQHLDEIYQDSRLFTCSMTRDILIRQEFVDDYNEPSIRWPSTSQDT